MFYENLEAVNFSEAWKVFCRTKSVKV